MGSADFARRQRQSPAAPSVFEVICCDCGDNPYLDYSEVPARFQRLRGPYTLREGVAAYQQHLAEDYLAAGAR